MKLIDSTNFEYGLIEAKTRLRYHGILASTTDEFANIPRYKTFARELKKGIWIPLEEQYIDAVMLLENPNHKVTTGLTEEQMQELEMLAKNSLFTTTANFFNKLAKAILLIFVLGMVAYVISKQI